MKNIAGALDADDVEAVMRLVDSLDRSNCDFLQVEVGNMRLTIGKGEPPATIGAPTAAPRAAERNATAAPAEASRAEALPAAAAPLPASEAAASEGVAITAPIMGRFYAKPEPAAETFVKVGSVVEEDMTVGLIEVMKMFTPVPAGVRGVISEICVADAEFVEFGQPLFRVDPRP